MKQENELPELPLVTYHVMSFNRLAFLRNLIVSFQLCNVYPRYEWFITDFGSKDGSREFLGDLAKRDAHFTIFHDDEKKYFDYLETLDLAPKTKNQKVAVIGGRFRNKVRRLAKGELFFDLSDDHQFIRKGDWIREMLSIYNHRIRSVSRDDTTGIVTRAFLFARYLKKSNTVSPVQRTEDGIEYFVYNRKVFDNYCLMKRSTYQKLGPFLEIDQLTDPTEILAWRNDSTYIHYHPDYSKRAAKYDLKPIIMKFPYIVEFPNAIIPRIDSRTEPLLVPLFKEGEVEQEFSTLNRPVSSDEIFLAKGIQGLQLPAGRLRRKGCVWFKAISHKARQVIQHDDQ